MTDFANFCQALPAFEQIDGGLMAPMQVLGGPAGGITIKFIEMFFAPAVDSEMPT